MNCNLLCCVTLCSEKALDVLVSAFHLGHVPYYHDVLGPTSIARKFALEWLLSPSPATLAVASHDELSS